MGRGKHNSTSLKRIVDEWVASNTSTWLAEQEATDPRPIDGGPELWAWYKRQNRASLKRMGYIRMDVLMSPGLYKKLRPYLMEYRCHQYEPRGSELVRFLEDLEIT